MLVCSLGRRFFFCVIIVFLNSALLADDTTLSDTTYEATTPTMSEVVVTASTGSFIERNVSKQPIPIVSIGRDDMAKNGYPSLGRILEQLSISPTAYIRQDQVSHGGTVAGVKTINLRGLGAHRNLVLLNGKRLSQVPAQIDIQEKAAAEAVDVGNIPIIALARTEVLTNGGAVTYGSDAISGVVNFVTRNYFEGVELSINQARFEDRQGENGFSIIGGKSFSAGHLMVAFEREIVEEYTARAFDQARDDFSYGGGNWPLGTSSLSNPGTFFVPMQFATPIADPQCGNVDPSAQTDWLSSGRCLFSYQSSFSVIEPEKREKAFVAAEYLASDQLRFSVEVLYSKLDSIYRASPSWPPISTNAGISANLRFWNQVPLSNPGLADVLSQLDSTQRSAFEEANGAWYFGRAIGSGSGPANFPKPTETSRVVVGFDYAFGETLSLEGSVLRSKAELESVIRDVRSDRFKEALFGLAGDNCPRTSPILASTANDTVRGQASVGCYWFNTTGNAANALPTDSYYNDPIMFDYIFGVRTENSENELTSMELSLSGEYTSSFLDGSIPWILGIQHRELDVSRQFSGSNVCDGPCETEWHFLSAEVSNSATFKRYSMRGEAVVPLTDRFTLDVGFRYEDFELDYTITPKIAFLYELSELITLRGSYQSVTRAPRSDSTGTGADQLVSLGRSEDGSDIWVTTRNPPGSSLEPESSDNFSAGVIFAPSQFQSLSIDYYYMDFTDLLLTEDPFCECAEKFLADGTPYDPSVHQLAEIGTVNTELVNSDLGNEISGIDLQYSLRKLFLTDFGAYELTAGASANWILSFDMDRSDGSTFDGVGAFGNGRDNSVGLRYRSIPEVKGSIYASISDLSRYAVSVRHNYASSLSVPESYLFYNQFPELRDIPSFATTDFHISRQLGQRAEIVFSILNAFDEDAPLAPTDHAFDPVSHNPLGRVFEVRFRWFGGD